MGDSRRVVRFVVTTLLVAFTTGGVGWLVGRRDETPRRGPAPRSVPFAQRAAALRAECAEWAPPESDAAGLAAWVTHEAQVSLAFHRHGFAFGWESGEAADAERLRACADVDDAARFAMLLDLWSETAQHADRRATRDALLRLARALDPEPQRDAIRAALLANGVAEVRILAADFGTDPLPAATALLLGLALWRCGEPLDAIDTWESAAVAHPDEPLLHLLLAWRLPALERERADDVRRHLVVAQALLPGSQRLRALLTAPPE